MRDPKINTSLLHRQHPRTAKGLPCIVPPVITQSTHLLSLTSLYNEKELLLRISDGDEEAFRALFDHYTAQLYPYVAGMVKSKTLAEEMIQETFIRIWMHRDQLPEIENPRAWIFRIAANECLNHLRRKTLEEKAGNFLRLHTEAATGDDIQYRETKAAIAEAIAGLPPQRKLIYELSRERGYKIAQIAEELDISQSTVKGTLSKALEAIREHLRRKGYLVSLLAPLATLLKIFFSAIVLFLF